MNRWIRENRGFLIFALCLGVVRGAIAQYNPIPSGSMHPNLLEGDVVLVNRLAYDLKVPLTNLALLRLGEPARGDVVTFYSPADNKYLIKRLVGLPGDTIEMRGKRLFINNVAAEYRPLVQLSEALLLTEDLGNGAHEIQWTRATTSHDDFGPLTIPADQYLMLGDNRDHSADSRYIGLVPRRLLTGRAHHILVSADTQSNWLPRFDRFGKPID